MRFSIENLAKSLVIIPRDYNDVRPHHVVVLYSAVHLLTSTRLYKDISNKILSILSTFSEKCIPLIHAGIVPDFIIRWGIRLQLRDHLNILAGVDAESELASKLAIVKELHEMPIAIETAAANEQHYEVPARFYDLCLGPRKKVCSTASYWLV